MKDVKLLLFCPVLLLLCSCNQQIQKKFPNHKDYHVLHVSLDETKTSLFDIFEKVELIPLETCNEALIKVIRKILYYNNVYYVFDEKLGSLFLFDQNGKFINKIHRIGQGPGEYQLIYDFFVDTLQSQIGMLSPYGSVLYYSIQGDFIKKINLPPPPPSYLYVELLRDNICLFWTAPAFPPLVDEDALTFVSMDTGEKTGGLRYEEHHALWMWNGHVLHRDNKENVFLTRGFSNDVFIITPNGIQIAYTWDFGNRNNNMDKIKLSNSVEELNETAKRFRESFNNGESFFLSYCFSRQNQTDLYYYAYLRFAENKRKHLFYHKQTNQYHFFEHTAEGHSINNPLLMTNEFMLAELDFGKKESIAPYLLSDKDREILSNFQEEDNPCLLKFTFKR